MNNTADARAIHNARVKNLEIPKGNMVKDFLFALPVAGAILWGCKRKIEHCDWETVRIKKKTSFVHIYMFLLTSLYFIKQLSKIPPPIL